MTRSWGVELPLRTLTLEMMSYLVVVPDVQCLLYVCLGALEVGSVVTEDDGGWAASTHESCEGLNEGVSRQVVCDLDVDCSNSKASEDASVAFDFAPSTLHKNRPEIVDAH